MSAEHQAADPAAGSRILERWINPRRKRFWAIVALLAYTLCGFFLVPLLVESQIVDTIDQEFGRTARVQQVAFNPFSLRLSVRGFELDDEDGTRLAAFEEFVANFQLSSLFRWALTFSEVRLTGPFLLYERFEPGDSRLLRLLEATADEEPAADADAGLPRLLIQKLQLERGLLDVIDRVPQPPVSIEVGPVDITIDRLNTLPDKFGQQAVTVRLSDGARISWQGSIGLAPFESEGSLRLERIPLEPATAYLRELLPVESLTAVLNTSTKYRVAERADGSVELGLDDLGLEVTDVAVEGLRPDFEFLAVRRMALDGGQLRYPNQTIRFASALVSEPSLSAWMDENGALSLSRLSPAGGDEAADSTPGTAGSPWQLDIDELLLQGGELDFSDNRFDPPARVALEAIELALSTISNRDGQVIPVRLSAALSSNGRVNFEGTTVALPEFRLQGNMRTAGLSLELAQPYVARNLNVRIESGSLSSDSELTVTPSGVQSTGSLEVAGLAVRDAAESEDLLGWATMSIDRYEADAAGRSLALSRVVVDGLYTRVQIEEDRSVNLARLVVDSGEPASTAEPEASEPLSIVVGGVAVNDGAMDFSDLSLPLPFAASITALNGSISTIDNSSDEPANIRLEGRVDDYGLARIQGSLAVFDPVNHTDVAVEFRNLMMSRMTPYTVQFAGREIDEGKLDLDLEYRINAGQLIGQNAVVLSDLVLGKSVDVPDAVNLPLDLAVALLTDSNGVIDVDLPVEGNVNDPEFRIGGVIWQAFVGLITKVATAPFRLLGSLIGIDSEDLGEFQFLAGRADLTPPEIEKIEQLKQALGQRPELKIEISGPYDAAVDTASLQFLQLRRKVLDRLGREAELDHEAGMLDAEIRTVLENLFTERFPQTPLETLRAAHTSPPANDSEGRPQTDELAYAADLRDRLLESEPISQPDLEQLANDRAEAVRSAFLATEDFEAARIAVAEPVAVESEDGEWVVMELAVVTD